MTAQDTSIAAEVAAKHGHSAQPESQQVIAVLHALEEVIAAERLPATPTSFFAAGMSALEKPETRASVQVVQAMCTLLGLVLPRVPNSVLRAKWVGAAALITRTLQEHNHQPGLVKAALLVLSQLLAAMEHGTEAWPSAVAPMACLLGYITDPRAKVRKRAHSGTLEVLAALQHAPMLGPASDAVAKAAVSVLPGPEAAARAAAQVSNKGRAAAEEAIAASVAAALHLLGMLKHVLPLLAGPSVKVVVDQLFTLYPLRQPLLSRSTTQVLTALCSSPTSHITPATLSELLLRVLEAGDAVWVRADAEAILALTQLVEGGCLRLASTDPGLCGQRLPRAVHTLVPQLAAAQDGVRHGTCQALRNLLRGCITPEMAAAAVEASKSTAPRRAASALESVVVALASSLGAQYQEGWDMALPVVSELFSVLADLPPECRRLAAPLLHSLGELVGGAEEAAEARAAEAGPSSVAPAAAAVSAARAALSSALLHLGPETVMGVLPLNIAEGLQGKPGVEPRTWLLPMLRKSVAGAPLGFWATKLLPLARDLATRSGAAATAGQSALANTCRVLEMQIWATLPAFVSWAPDLPAVYPTVAKDLAGAFSARPDLRGYVCLALERMVLQARQVLRQDEAEGPGSSCLGPGQPLPELSLPELEGGDDDESGRPTPSVASFRASLHRHSAHHGKPHGRGQAAASPHDAGEHHKEPPAGYTVAHARACMLALRGLNKNWLGLLCKSFLAAEPEQRGLLARTLSCMAVVSEPAVTATYFKTAVTRLVKVMEDAAKDVPPPDVITDGGNDVVSRRCAFTELALVLGTGLDDASLVTLLKAATPSVQDTQEPVLQKKGYKVLAYLCTARPAFLRQNLQQVLGLVVAGAATALSAAKRYRLRCLQPLILLLAGVEALPEGALPKLAAPAKVAAKGSKAAAKSSKPADSDDEGDDDDDDGEGMSDADGENDAMAGAVPASSSNHRQQVVSVLVTELMLCCKEANMKTRLIAYELLVAIAHAMDDMDPGELDASADVMEQDGEDAPLPKGGLVTLFTMVMAGLAGQTPHMISASIMALARLLYEFGAKLQPLVPQVLPPVLSLLRSRSRETIKAVLGFCKVCAMRMPVPLLTAHMGPILEGILLWAADSKNKFKLKVRVIIERLARRCGFEAVAVHIPASDTRLLTHIRKEAAKKLRRRTAASQAGDEDEDEDDDEGDDDELTGGRRHARSEAGGKSQSGAASAAKLMAGRTARPSEWGRSTIFSEGGLADDDEDGRSRASAGARSGRAGTAAARSQQGAGSQRGAARQREKSGGLRLQEGVEGGDPMDLLDPTASRQLTRSAAGVRAKKSAAPVAADYARDPDGKMMIADEDALMRDAAMKRKRKNRGADDDFPSDESELEDLQNVAGLGAAMRSAAKSTAYQKALSVKSGGQARSESGAKSMSGRSAGGQSRASSASGRRGPSVHGGDRFKPRTNTGGDVKGRSKVEPYAYWQFDRKMLNRRPAKQRSANASLSNLVTAAQKGAAKGAKAKAQHVSKKARQ